MSSRRKGLLSGAQRNRASTAPKPRAHPDLPDYEPPSCPLDGAALRGLAELHSKQSTQNYEVQLKTSIKRLTHSVRDINDLYAKRRGDLKRLQERRAQSGLEKNDREYAEESAVSTLRDQVPALTEECNETIQRVIDLRVELEDGRLAVQTTRAKVEAESAREQARQQNEGEDAEENMNMDFTGPRQLLKSEKQKSAATYAAMSQYEKYGKDNDYTHFKALWHDAVHGVDGKPLPDASKWFTQNGARDDDSDDDLVVAGEHLSILCPLSGGVMTEPFTSKSCRHTFNRPGLVQFLSEKPNRRSECPQTGCSTVLSLDDFFFDDIMLRRIKRAQAQDAKGRGGAMEEDDEDEDDVDEGGDSSMQVTQTRSIKKERAHDRGRRLLEEIEDAV
ncbi:hypothetical protein GGR56DRAFT_637199 [Xylariaceae sp. FL0804]|nr:hypothetical protein GGR56DRAFT_637199 [Xylariaceae sp. FL0804]